ncbi:hypothetical protein CAOG_008660 [Capsaspora owczarzaki ATCC 30864]|uniref:TIR domain-containing protein n=1 Tax=Capsaspora owczarzaki (strain ATCC 30864) TaxID=595528 RepID=A0A0D2VNR5_CAPO3|nr:hypothetical protein CAOG_008660 [Capsaspora owczarzaki ATCC 30864]
MGRLANLNGKEEGASSDACFEQLPPPRLGPQTADALAGRGRRVSVRRLLSGRRPPRSCAMAASTKPLWALLILLVLLSACAGLSVADTARRRHGSDSIAQARGSSRSSSNQRSAIQRRVSPTEPPDSSTAVVATTASGLQTLVDDPGAAGYWIELAAGQFVLDQVVRVPANATVWLRGSPPPLVANPLFTSARAEFASINATVLDAKRATFQSTVVGYNGPPSPTIGIVVDSGATLHIQDIVFTGFVSTIDSVITFLDASHGYFTNVMFYENGLLDAVVHISNAVDPPVDLYSNGQCVSTGTDVVLGFSDCIFFQNYDNLSIRTQIHLIGEISADLTLSVDVEVDNSVAIGNSALGFLDTSLPASGLVVGQGAHSISILNSALLDNVGLSSGVVDTSTIFFRNITATLADSLFIAGNSADLVVIPQSSAGVLNAVGGGSAIVRNCVFERQHSISNGGTISLDDRFHCEVINCSFTNNTANTYGGGVALNAAASMTIANSSLFGGFAGCGGAAAILGSSARLNILSSLFQNNSGVCAGAIYIVDDGQLLLSDCTFLSNSALSGGAIVAGGSAVIDIFRCIFMDCRAGGSGGALHLSQTSRTLISDTVFFGNRAASGGVLWLADTSNAVLTNCTLTSNYAVLSGGVAVVEGYSSVNVTQSRITSNAALSKPGGAFRCASEAVLVLTQSVISGNHAVAAAVAEISDLATLAIYSSVISNNVATDSGGVFTASTVEPSISPDGSFLVDSALLDFSEGFTDLFSQLGYRKFSARSPYFGLVLLTDTIFLNNSARKQDAGVGKLSNSELVVRNCTFEGNSAPAGSGGTLLFMTRFAKAAPSMLVENSTFAHNSAQLNGGAIYFPTPTIATSTSTPAVWSTVRVLNSTFSANSASQGGAVFAEVSASLPIESNNVFTGQFVRLYGEDIATVCTQVDFTTSKHYNVTTPLTLLAGRVINLGAVVLLDAFDQVVLFDEGLPVTLEFALQYWNGSSAEHAIQLWSAEDVDALTTFTSMPVFSGRVAFHPLTVFGTPGAYQLVPLLSDGRSLTHFANYSIRLVILECSSSMVMFNYNGHWQCMTVDSPAFAATAVLAGLSAVVLLFQIVGVVVIRLYRDHKVVQVAGEEWCYMLAFSSFMCLLQIFLHLAPRSDVVCGFIVWDEHVCFILAFSLIAVKLRTGHSLSEGTGSRNLELKIDPHKLFFHCAIALGISGFIVAIWQIVSPPKASLRSVSSTELQYECATETVGFLYALYAYEVITLIACHVLGFRIRRATTLFNEAKLLSWVVWVVTVFGVGGAVLVLALSSAVSATGLQVFINISFFVSGCALTFIIFLPKIYSIISGSWKAGGLGKEVVLCYTIEDKSFMKRIEAMLTEAGIEVWFDELRQHADKTRRREVAQTVMGCQSLIFIVSEHSVKSPYCQTEVQFAFDSGVRVFPVIISNKFMEVIDPGLEMLLKRFQWVIFDEPNKPESALDASSDDLSAASHKQKKNLRAERMLQLKNAVSNHLKMKSDQRSKPASHVAEAGNANQEGYAGAPSKTQTHAQAPNTPNELAAELKPKDLFISWAHIDHALVRERLWPDLEARHIDCWIDVSALVAGDFWRRAIGQAIKHCKVFLFVMTPASIKSQYCQEELLYAASCKKLIYVIHTKSCKRELDEFPDIRAVIADAVKTDFSDTVLYLSHVDSLAEQIAKEFATIREQEQAVALKKQQDREQQQLRARSRLPNGSSSVRSASNTKWKPLAIISSALSRTRMHGVNTTTAMPVLSEAQEGAPTGSGVVGAEQPEPASPVKTAPHADESSFVDVHSPTTTAGHALHYVREVDTESTVSGISLDRVSRYSSASLTPGDAATSSSPITIDSETEAEEDVDLVKFGAQLAAARKQSRKLEMSSFFRLGGIGQFTASSDRTSIRGDASMELPAASSSLSDKPSARWKRAAAAVRLGTRLRPEPKSLPVPSRGPANTSRKRSNSITVTEQQQTPIEMTERSSANNAHKPAAKTSSFDSALGLRSKRFAAATATASSKAPSSPISEISTIPMFDVNLAGQSGSGIQASASSNIVIELEPVASSSACSSSNFESHPVHVDHGTAV